MKGETGYDTWLNGSAEYTGNTGVWTQISVDEQLGLVYLPVESPTGDYYGGHRPGNDLYGESLVCVDLKTGQRKWHFQLVHHPLWDMDISSAPILADINVDGRDHQSRGATHQAGNSLRVRPRYGAAGLADRREARAEGRCAGRVVLAHAADPDETCGIRPQRGFGGRSDRLHA